MSTNLKTAIIIVFSFFSSIKSASAYKSITSKIFLNPPIWVRKQIQSDFKHVKNISITKKMLENSLEQLEYPVLYRIRNNNVNVTYVSSKVQALIFERHASIHATLKKLATLVKLPNVDFIVDVGDGFSGDSTNLKIPIFAFSKNKKIDKKIILIPDSGVLYDHTNLQEQAKIGEINYPWKLKAEKAFWRGATTGGFPTWQNFRQFPRIKLIELGENFPELIDAKFTMFAQINETTLLTHLKKYQGDIVSVSEHLKYKYQLLIDGNTTAWLRSYWQMFSKCVIFKQNSENIQWYYQGLIPNTHYILIKHDLSDLIEKIKWAKVHDHDMQAIAMQAYLFANNNLKYEDMLAYFYAVLIEYSKLQDFNKINLRARKKVKNTNKTPQKLRKQKRLIFK